MIEIQSVALCGLSLIKRRIKKYIIMDIIQCLVTPLIGGVIGYITNDIAIRMLFRPHKVKYLFGFRIPFTPGIIPKEKGRIANAIAGAISENLMSIEVLEKNLLSEEMLQKIEKLLNDFVATQKSNSESVKEFLLHYLTDEELQNIKNNIERELSNQISVSLENINIGETVSEIVVNHVASKLRIEGLNLDIPKVLKSLVGNSLWGEIASIIETPAKKYLTKNINQMLVENGPGIINKTIHSEIEIFLSIPIKDLLSGREEQINQTLNFIMNAYKTIISEHLPKILETIDISSIIESKINEMDVKETESLIFKIMNKELKAIVWLGALLGLLMGCINLFI